MDARTTLITGSAKRLGREIVCHLASQGWNIILHYNTAENEAKILAAEVTHAWNVQVHLWQNDFHNFNTQQLYNLPPFQLLINNAAVFANDTLLNCTPTTLQSHYQVNTFAPALLMQHLAKTTKTAANVINIADSDAQKFKANFFSYISSKKSLEALTEHAAVLLAPHIRVNAIALGHILRGERQSSAHFQQAQKNTLLPHAPATVAQLLHTIDFILATPCLTGQTLMLDGGGHLAQNAGGQ